MNIDIAVLELACSRFCHDLISPIGAVNNGLELLEDEEDPALVAEARGLAERSAKRASALLQTYRCAFGNAGNQAGFGLGESLKLARDFLEGARVTMGSLPAVLPSDAPAGLGKLLLLGVMVLAETLPRGGTIAVTFAGEGATAGFLLAGEGPQVAAAEESRNGLAGISPAQLDARNVLPFFAGLSAQRIGYSLTLSQGQNGRIELAANPRSA
ncbi:histidine phosphotransferase ChpT [Dongia mobilis]|uniref:Histidine phosphotransferase ChpT n=1 Tax=Dongia mobilis TaxID=578943 RepID=A0A4R6WXA8_9PROT|nr:histidine phosphotransferase family protein [Dongia mobilis]TDQ84337.1 histidine phosphotransferase ChpT [Dongia mobilis]